MTAAAPITLDSLNNPGAVPVTSPLQWQGTAPAAATDNLEAFEHPAYGIRTIARALIILQDARRTNDQDRLAKVASTVRNWAPALGSDLPAIGVDPALDVTDYGTMRRMVEQTAARLAEAED